jgi:hypothetical protein
MSRMETSNRGRGKYRCTKKSLAFCALTRLTMPNIPASKRQYLTGQPFPPLCSSLRTTKSPPPDTVFRKFISFSVSLGDCFPLAATSGSTCNCCTTSRPNELECSGRPPPDFGSLGSELRPVNLVAKNGRKFEQRPQRTRMFRNRFSAGHLRCDPAVLGVSEGNTFLSFSAFA